MAEIKDLSKWPVFRLLLGGVLAGLFVGIQEFLQLSFACPCVQSSNVWFGMLFFLLPAVAFTLLNVLAWHCGRCHLGKLSCHECMGLSCRQLWPRILFPAFMWVTAVFLDGAAFACMTTRFCTYLEAPDLVVCRVEDDNGSDEEERCFRYWAFVSKLIGLWLVVVLVLAAVLLKFSYKWGKECSCWEEDWKSNYIAATLKRNEVMLMDLLLEETKDETKEKLTEALAKKHHFWEHAEEICKDVKNPEDAQDAQGAKSDIPGNAADFEGPAISTLPASNSEDSANSDQPDTYTEDWSNREPPAANSEGSANSNPPAANSEPSANSNPPAANSEPSATSNGNTSSRPAGPAR